MSPAEALEAAHGALGGGSNAASVPPALRPSSKLAVAGLDAIAALGARFLADDTLRWEDQVVVVADRPEERQLAGLVAVFCRASRATELVAPAPLPEREWVSSADASDALRDALGARA